MNAKMLESIPGEDAALIVDLPDGFYSYDRKTGQKSGPFATRLAALEDMDSPEGGSERENLEEAEARLGIANWIDPETGLPAEESIPHIEDH